MEWNISQTSFERYNLEIESFHSMLDASIIAGQLGDVRISEGDQILLYMRNLPNKVQSFSNCIRMFLLYIKS